MIFNTNSNSDQSGGSTLNSSHLYKFPGFNDAYIITNMFIDSDGHLCKRNSTKKLYTYNGKSIINNYHFTCPDEYGQKQDLIYFIETNDDNDKPYINAIIHKTSDDTYAESVTKLTLPGLTYKYCFFNDKDNIYAIGNGKIYTYKHGSETGFQSVEPYIPLLRVHGSNTKLGKDFEYFNLLTSKVHVTLNTYNTSSVYLLGEKISSIDKAIFNGVSISDYSVTIKQYNSSITFQRTFANNEEAPLDVYYTTIDTDEVAKYKADIMNPIGAVFLIYNGKKVLCLYTNTHAYISGYSNCDTDDFDINMLYFPNNKGSIIDVSSVGTCITKVIPLNNNRFAIVTGNGSILIHNLYTSEKTIADNVNDLILLNSDCIEKYDLGLSNIDDGPITYNNNDIYVANNGSIKCVTIDDHNNINIENIKIPSVIQSYLSRYLETLSNYYRLHYCKAQDYLYLYSSGFNTIVYDIKHKVFYVYDGDYKISSFVTDDIFIGSDWLTFKRIEQNSFGTESDGSYISGQFCSKSSSLGTVSTKTFNSIAIKVETFDDKSNSIKADSVIVLKTDMGDINTTLYGYSSAYNKDTSNINPCTCIYHSEEDENKTFNDMAVLITLPSILYKLDDIIVDRDSLDELSAGNNDLQ